ncbi:MAG: uncharacterized protein QOF02_1732 [Blastocatellia bacterium]|jgi:uncharacterized protein YegP (UPF0339 family)|nr:uncharacterized protein [Blastocatellia bacterium]
MNAEFEIKRGSGGKHHFNLKAENGEIILTSEIYESRQGAEKGIASVRTNAPNDAQYERKTASNDQPYFVLKAENGEPIGTSETYTSVAAMENGIESVKRNAPNAAITGETKDRRCFVATAVFETDDCPELDSLRKFRDQRLLTNPTGRAFVNFYYLSGPHLARAVSRSPRAKLLIKNLLKSVCRRLERAARLGI